jgi:SAM-dependent methyltransferase
MPGREKWNARWTEDPHAGGMGQEPSPFLVAQAARLPRAGRALDAGGGPGHNALWLARHGLDVTLADVSDVALARAEARAREEGLALRTLEVDLEVEPLPPGPWDVILCTYLLHRPLFPAFAAALAPGGLLLFAHATRTNRTRHPRPGPDHLLDDGEAPRLVRAAGLEVVDAEEGWMEAGRHEARVVARRA